VIDGDWINSEYTFKDGTVMPAAEAFAYGFQDWLKTGQAENEQMKNIFQKFAEFIARAFNSLKEFINLTPEIESVYNQLLSGDDSLLAKAERAVEENDRAYRQSMQDQKQQAAEKAKADEENAKKAAEAEREEKSEVTEEAQNIPTAEELSENVEKIIDETETQTSDNAINNAIENLSVSDETKAKTEEVLNDPNSTQIDKAEAVTEATGEEYKALGDMLFQMTQEVGEEKAKEAFNQIMGKGKVLFQVTDLTQDFADTKNGIITQEDVENYINSLINQIIDTATEPLKIRITDNQKVKEHIIETKVELKGNQKYRHNAALSKLERIINNAVKVGEEPTDAEHNTNNETKKHKESVLNYITFESPVKIGDEYFTVIMKAEETLGQSPDVLNLYNVQVKKSSGAAALSNNSTLQTTANGDNNTTTTGNVNKTLFQIAGEIGAANLDNSEEVAEGVSRMQNLAVAKEMEADGKEAKTIRLATGWEKGSDGKWKYEIDDSNISLDLYAGMKTWERFHPEYKRLQKKFLNGEVLSEEEEKTFEQLGEEYLERQDKKTDLSEGEKLFGKTFQLEDVLDYPELYKAYPTLQAVSVTIKDSENNGVQGQFEEDTERIVLFKPKGMSFSNWEDKTKTVLLHEIQHAIQKIEGFAKGGSDEQFKAISVAELEQEIDDLQKIADGEKKSRLYSQGDAQHRIEELEARIVEIEENALEGQVEVNGNVYENEFEAYRSLAGEVEARNV
ncbi:MAG: hypothetical protein J6P07_03145, partial [Spirochaetaceae bacterium]|nr:hypothetical protein [Spirochaetaceae bacterium]